MKIRSLGFVHLCDVLSTHIAGVLVGCVTRRVRLIEGGWPSKHGTQLACLVVLGPRRGSGIVVGRNLGIELGYYPIIHWCTVGRSL